MKPCNITVFVGPLWDGAGSSQHTLGRPSITAPPPTSPNSFFTSQTQAPEFIQANCSKGSSVGHQGLCESQSVFCAQLLSGFCLQKLVDGCLRLGVGFRFIDAHLSP